MSSGPTSPLHDPYFDGPAKTGKKETSVKQEPNVYPPLLFGFVEALLYPIVFLVLFILIAIITN